MKTEIVVVTPSQAKKWLERNTDNRHITPSVVGGLADAIRRGEWILSHQGIAFGKDGKLLDGQHRLLAILEANLAVKMAVTWDVDNEAFKVMDIGKKRTVSDILNVSQSLAAVARFFAVIEETQKRSAITPQYLIPFIDTVREPHSELTNFCPIFRRIWSSAAVQSAAVLRILDGEDADYIKIVYHSLVHLEFDSMPLIGQALVRQYGSGTTRVQGTDFFARSLKVFTRANANARKIQITSIDSTLKYAREVISREVHGVGKIAAKKVAAKRSVNLV